MNDWQHKEEWKRYGKNFSLVVSRHSVPAQIESGCYDEVGPHRWCIYVYFYKKHTHFEKFTNNDIWQDACNIGMHGGCSFFRRHHDDEGAEYSIQIGCDYNHIGDWRYTQLATPEDAYSVFHDAEELFKKFDSMESA